MIEVSYIMKRKIKKIFFEVISNSKIFNINFFNEIVSDQDFTKLTGGLDKGGEGLDKVEYGNYFSDCIIPIIFDWKEALLFFTNIYIFKGVLMIIFIFEAQKIVK